jgi:hypothetical protein
MSLCTWWLQYRRLQVMSKVSPVNLQEFIDTRLTLTPSFIHNSITYYNNYVIIVSDWNCLKSFWLFFVCNHHVHRDCLITLYICVYIYIVAAGTYSVIFIHNATVDVTLLILISRIGQRNKVFSFKPQPLIHVKAVCDILLMVSGVATSFGTRGHNHYVHPNSNYGLYKITIRLIC